MFYKNITFFSILFLGIFLSTLNVHARSEFFSHAQTLSQDGIIQGHNDESDYRLRDTISRAEAMKLILGSADIEQNNCLTFSSSSTFKYSFSDVSSSIGDLCGFVEGAVQNNIISSSILGNRFYPTRPITRADFSDAIVRAFDSSTVGLIGSIQPNQTYYTDTPTTLPQASSINRLATTGCLNTTLATFRPYSSITRGEAFKIMACLIGKKNGENAVNNTTATTTNTQQQSTGSTQVSSSNGYIWSTTSYGTCSKTCGGGVQTRTISCKKTTDNSVVADSFCQATGVAKPVTQKLCNVGLCQTNAGTTVSTPSCLWTYHSVVGPLGTVSPNPNTTTCTTSLSGTVAKEINGNMQNVATCGCKGNNVTTPTQSTTNPINTTVYNCSGVMPTGPGVIKSSSTIGGIQDSIWSYIDNITNSTSTNLGASCKWTCAPGYRENVDTNTCSIIPSSSPCSWTYHSVVGPLGTVSPNPNTTTCTTSLSGTVAKETSGNMQNVATCKCTGMSSYTYSWQSGSYGSCSKTCGGGTQTRTVSCQRNDGTSVLDSYCTGAKPSTTQACNTQACATNSCSWTFHSVVGPVGPMNIDPNTTTCTTSLSGTVAKETSGNMQNVATCKCITNITQSTTNSSYNWGCSVVGPATAPDLSAYSCSANNHGQVMNVYGGTCTCIGG